LVDTSVWIRFLANRMPYAILTLLLVIEYRSFRKAPVK